MNGFEVFRFQHVLPNAIVLVQLARDIAHHVFDKLGIIVSALGHVFFIGPFEQAVQLAGSLRLDDIDQLLDPDESAGAGIEGHV